MDFLKKLFLAPMAGITDTAFREICLDFGADIIITEMVSSRGLYYKDKKTADLLSVSERERGHIGVQLFGCEPEIMAYAAKKVEELDRFIYVDINMGCPMPKIVNNGDGSALMKNPRLAGEVVESVKKAVSLPVGVKFRSGWDSVTAPDFAKVIEESGADFITVHGRTKEQLYTGTADRTVIEAVKDSVKIPVLGNGDIFSPESADDMYKTGCDGLMIARGALGNPFLFSQIKAFSETGTYETPSDSERLMTALRQVRRMCELKGDRRAIPEARKHIAWYMKGIRGSAKYKNGIMTASSLSEAETLISELISERENDCRE